MRTLSLFTRQWVVELGSTTSRNSLQIVRLTLASQSSTLSPLPLVWLLRVSSPCAPFTRLSSSEALTRLSTMLLCKNCQCASLWIVQVSLEKTARLTLAHTM